MPEVYADYTRELDRSYGRLGSHERFQRLKVQALREPLAELERERGAPLRVLDVGAGVGTLLALLPERYRRVGIEPDSSMLAQRRPGSFELVRASGQRLPFGAGAFDLVTLVCVTHHVPRAERVPLLQECRRVLATGGRLAVIEHNGWNIPVRAFLKAFVAVDRDAEFLTPRELRRLLREAGFEAAGGRYLAFFPGLLDPVGRLERGLGWLPLGGQFSCVGRRP